jgi:hypothetical protein
MKHLSEFFSYIDPELEVSASVLLLYLSVVHQDIVENRQLANGV